ncbi:hypothetical protein B0H13DRAFT_1029121 [Mycena leptocephala]|nr:hypothetical protein B0H13DRAFT_1029121 [Mycena leptocephala]
MVEGAAGRRRSTALWLAADASLFLVHIAFKLLLTPIFFWPPWRTSSPFPAQPHLAFPSPLSHRNLSPPGQKTTGHTAVSRMRTSWIFGNTAQVYGCQVVAAASKLGTVLPHSCSARPCAGLISSLGPCAPRPSRTVRGGAGALSRCADSRFGCYTRQPDVRPCRARDGYRMLRAFRSSVVLWCAFRTAWS